MSLRINPQTTAIAKPNKIAQLIYAGTLGTAIAFGGTAMANEVLQAKTVVANQNPDEKQDSQTYRFLSKFTSLDYAFAAAVGIQGIIVLILSISSARDTREIKKLLKEREEKIRDNQDELVLTLLRKIQRLEEELKKQIKVSDL